MTAKKGFKKGVDFFLTGDTEQVRQEASAMSNQACTDTEKNTDIDEYVHTHTETHMRPLPAMPRGERKTRRLNLLVRPTMYGKLSAIAARMDSSVNDLVNNVLEDFTSRNAMD